MGLGQIIRLRHRGWEGGYLPPHRAFRRLWLTPGQICAGLVLTVGATVGWCLLLPAVARWWARVLSFWVQQLGLDQPVFFVYRTVAGRLRVAVPCFYIDGGPTIGWTWFAIAAVTALGFVVSFKISKDSHLPWVYLIRAVCLIQATSLISRMAGRLFPHDPATYCANMLLFGMIFIGLVPSLLAMTFYIFEIGLLKKVALTVLMMAHLALFIPLQYLVHAWMLHVSLLFLPVLYFVFGPFLDVMVFIGFYSWAMSWSARHQSPVSMS